MNHIPFEVLFHFQSHFWIDLPLSSVRLVFLETTVFSFNWSPPSNIFFPLVLISWMVTLSSCLIWQIISFILPSNEYGCVYAWTTLGSGPTMTYRSCRFWQKKIIFSDEAHFDLAGYVNKKNYRIWGTENPHTYIEKPMHSKRVTVWCGFWSRGRLLAGLIRHWDLLSESPVNPSVRLMAI